MGFRSMSLDDGSVDGKAGLLLSCFRPVMVDATKNSNGIFPADGRHTHRPVGRMDTNSGMLFWLLTLLTQWMSRLPLGQSAAGLCPSGRFEPQQAVRICMALAIAARVSVRGKSRLARSLVAMACKRLLLFRVHIPPCAFFSARCLSVAMRQLPRPCS